ncbi:MAG: hypothetical protein A3E02_01635 [Candidatus Zambryskibacteria bacterium RIFCSPHIGHO2_12_FULL_38_34]|uniref:Uncharacterized protein n=1 Tax=Candidatus Zambryskibacteria bacterium RIFCSPLOWO2_12_FULL_39_16 TaxID=1802775 RepID=A0A1G2UUF2_9BACT|nr:MAG: hypothetical protein A3D37_02315 [Candidatus Zambryskibacteria bacterium RIFCSPHIGHO2_02_FULL_38_22]OHA98530.1 MAG: hypothetical protein A3E02_01635 [Candidatus Zambryskibacteria bacterium RIFCSPHIGHO2_12_FULL_38_34]OHB08752.1 MAG: hypothetical protein A3I19_02100 [Candidatus Zambryskibacteria bacterium RIFCSPLOWO2_02_FULL_38_13]OHB12882.1 MAG: hypothetical protein A3G46_02595 [Candidatus Zambryskibacteria bacterium RIFCSPLOWO2_12_FULL_39_16]
MVQELEEAYKKIFNKEPGNLENWEIAKDLMNNWNVPILGEDLAKRVIFKVVNHVIFPSDEITKEVVLKAENKATELFNELKTDEPHMDQIAILEREYYEKKRKEENNPLKLI